MKLRVQLTFRRSPGREMTTAGYILKLKCWHITDIFSQTQTPRNRHHNEKLQKGYLHSCLLRRTKSGNAYSLCDTSLTIRTSRTICNFRLRLLKPQKSSINMRLSVGKEEKSKERRKEGNGWPTVNPVRVVKAYEAWRYCHSFLTSAVDGGKW